MAIRGRFLLYSCFPGPCWGPAAALDYSRNVSDQPERSSPPPLLPVRLIGQAITRVVARAPWTWPLMRRSVRSFFDGLAGGWDERVRPDAPEHLAPLAEPSVSSGGNRSGFRPVRARGSGPWRRSVAPA